MPKYRFDEENHIHYINDVPVPGVTEILKSEGFINTDFMRPDACYRGDYVHYAIKLINLNKLDYGSIKPEFEGYVRAYTNFRTENKHLIIKDVELSVYSWLGYAGILDFTTHEGETVIDIWDAKTGKSKQKWWKWQLSGYKRAFEDMHLGIVGKRHSLRLFETGKYKIDTYEDEQDDLDWESIVRVHNLKHNKGG